MQTLSSEYISRHHYFTAKRESYRTAGGKIVDPYFFVELPPCVVAMALTKEREVIFIRQYRHPVGEVLIELPGGFIDPVEIPAQAVERELKEETGYSFSTVHYLGKTAANPGVLNNFTHLFLALEGVKSGEQSLDANEEIDIMLTSLSDAREMLMTNKIIQSMHALCMFHAFTFLDRQGSI